MNTRSAKPSALDEGSATKILNLIEQRFGFIVPADMRPKLRDILGVLLDETAYKDAEALCSALLSEREADILEAIAGQFTVPETHFFRVAPQIAAMRAHVLPAVVQQASSTRYLRVWSAGCSTGEEPYTVAMLIRDQIGEANGWQVHLVASDLNRHSLLTAREASYGAWSFRDTPDEIRDRYFTREGTKWRLSDSIREMVRFFQLNLAQFPLRAKEIADGHFDIILCRNVTIYFSEAARHQLYDELAHLLAPAGWLILGPSDPPPEAKCGLQPRVLPGAVLWQKAAGGAVLPKMLPRPSSALASRPAGTRSGQPLRGRRADGAARSATPPAGKPKPTTQPTPAPQQTKTAGLDPAAHLESGLRLLDGGEAEAAVESLRSAVYLDPTNPLAHFTLGRAYLQLTQNGRAAAETREALRLLEGRDDDDQVPDAGVTVGELRLATVAQFAILSHSRTG